MPFWNRKKAEPAPPADWMIPRDTPMPEEPRYSPPVRQPAPVAQSKQAVTFHDDGDISLNVSSVPEAKLAIKQLRLRKKELGIEKKQVNAELSNIRAGRQQSLGHRGSVMRGGGDVRKMVRGFQRLGRDMERSRHASKIAPYQDVKAVLDRQIMAVDRAIHTLEAYILEQSEKAKAE